MKNENLHWSSGSGILCLIFESQDQIDSCSCSGDNGPAVIEALTYFRKGQQFDAYSDQQIRAYLVECGIDDEEAAAMPRNDLEMYLVWLAAGEQRDVMENAETNGY